MKKLLFSAILFYISLFSFAQSADEQIGDCLNSSDFFLLDEKYPKLKEEIQTPMLKVLSEAILNAVFNRQKEAVQSIDSLVSNYQEQIGFDNVKNMLGWQNNILFRMGEYCAAYDRSNGFLEQVAPHLDTTTVNQLRASNSYYKSMCGQQKSELIRPNKDCVIPIYIEPIEIKKFRKGYHLHVPVTVNGIEERFIFDTGCPGGVFLSEEYANKFAVRITMDSLVVSGVGGSGWGKMGILDSISLGNMILKNLSVTVVPLNPAVDSIFKINAVLGSDIMKHAGEVQIFPKEGKIIFPTNKTPLPATGRNMMISQGDGFFIKAFSGDEKLVMLFDTGDSSSGLYNKYYQSHKEMVERDGKKETSLAGGFGGVNTVEFYNLATLPLRIGDKNFEMKNINVGTDSAPGFIGTGNDDGALGMSFINSFDKVTISFENMFIKVE